MRIDWKSVKQQTLWSYEELIQKLQAVLAYRFVQEEYDHTMKQAQAYARRVRRGYLQNRGDKTAFVDGIMTNLQKLEVLRTGTYSEWIGRIDTRERCAAFVRRTGFGFDQLVQTLQYLFRWVLPFVIPVREFVDPDSAAGRRDIETLRNLKIRSNLDLLEAGRTAAGRVQLARATGLPAALVLALVHKADISRLAYVRGKTVRHLCGGGYDSLEKIARARLPEMDRKMEAYYRTLGKTHADFKLVIPLSWMIGGARTVPRVVTE